jgi:hypothetical protein
VQRCERLVGVARQFEVYCTGYHGPRRTGIFGSILVPDAIDNLDNAMLPGLISTIDHLGSWSAHGRTCGHAVAEDPSGNNLRWDASRVGHWASLSDVVTACPAQPLSRSRGARHCRSMLLQKNRLSQEAQQSSRFDLQMARRRSGQVDDDARVARMAAIDCHSLVETDGRILAVIPREVSEGWGRCKMTRNTAASRL